MEIAKRLDLEGKGIFLYLNPDMWAYTARHATTRSHRAEHVLKPEDLTFRCVDIAGHRVYAVLYDVQNTFGVMESWGNPGLGLSIRGAEQLLEGIDHLWELPLSGDNKETPPEPTWTPESDAHDGLRERISELVNRAPRDPGTFVKSGPHDVFLYPTGMAAVHHSTRTVLKYRPGTLVILGVVFHSTHHHLLEESPHGFKHIGKVDEEAMDQLERWLDEQKAEDKPVSYVLVEFPGNPTLDTPDVARVKRLVSTIDHRLQGDTSLTKEGGGGGTQSEKHNFVLVVDDTIASFANVDLLDQCDILLTSLTKSFSGLANVMGGSIVLSPSSPHYTSLSPLFTSTHRNELFARDANVLLSNSNDFLNRAAILSRNAAAVAAFLSERMAGDPDCPVVKVRHPSLLPSRPLYDAFKRAPTPQLPEPAYGCLFTLDFENVDAASTFHDNCGFYPSPHLGAHVTIQLAYNMVAWGRRPEERARSRELGVKEEAVRISVGLEAAEDIVDTIRYALDKTVALKKDGYKKD